MDIYDMSFELNHCSRSSTKNANQVGSDQGHPLLHEVVHVDALPVQLVSHLTGLDNTFQLVWF